ncbi:MAG: MarR family transcriptional regulator [Deltaproteobacteria bacterium]|jgi:DNA-binding MarR family transcriptional regulator|nr:MarR family transcriptional regulator [Deltaproteobacteria bacterium]
MNKTFYRSEESIGFLTITAYRMLNSTLRRKLKELNIDLTPDQWGVLVLLWERGSATQEELAAANCVDKSAMSRILSDMRSKGLISKEIDAKNERKKNIRATDSSLGLRERVFAAASESMRHALDGVSREDAATCMNVLDAIKRNLQEKYGKPWG